MEWRCLVNALADSSQAREILMEEGNVQPVRCPVTVCGDIHGQFVSITAFSLTVADRSTICLSFSG